MAVVAGATSTAYQAAGTSLNWNHTPAAADGLVVVSVGWDYSIGSPTCTYDGAAMTKIASNDGATPGCAMFYKAITPGLGAKNIALSWSNSRACRCGAVSYSGHSPSTPVGAVAQANGAVGATSVTVVGKAGGMAQDSTACSNVCNTPGAGQAEFYSGYAGAASYKAGAASTALTWVAAANWYAYGVCVLPPSGGCIWFF